MVDESMEMTSADRKDATLRHLAALTASWPEGLADLPPRTRVTRVRGRMRAWAHADLTAVVKFAIRQNLKQGIWSPPPDHDVSDLMGLPPRSVFFVDVLVARSAVEEMKTP